MPTQLHTRTQALPRGQGIIPRAPPRPWPLQSAVQLLQACPPNKHVAARPPLEQAGARGAKKHVESPHTTISHVQLQSRQGATAARPGVHSFPAGVSIVSGCTQHRGRVRAARCAAPLSSQSWHARGGCRPRPPSSPPPPPCSCRPAPAAALRWCCPALTSSASTCGVGAGRVAVQGGGHCEHRPSGVPTAGDQPPRPPLRKACPLMRQAPPPPTGCSKPDAGVPSPSSGQLTGEALSTRPLRRQRLHSPPVAGAARPAARRAVVAGGGALALAAAAGAVACTTHQARSGGQRECCAPTHLLLPREPRRCWAAPVVRWRRG